MLQRLSERFAAEIQRSHESERALNNLDRFIQGVGFREFYFQLLLDRPELVKRLARMFAASKFLSNVLASHPTLIEPVFADPAVLIPSPAAMADDLLGLIEERTRGNIDDVEGCLDALRLFMNRQVLNAGLLDLSGKIDRREVETALSDIAECCVSAALRFARTWIDRAGSISDSTQAGQFLIVGMGKLASRELGYGSDLDVIFIFDCDDSDASNAAEAQHYFVRLAQRFISALQTSTGEGACYEIDARLRPSGNQGVLVTSLASFERYHRTSAQIWERQALLRARAVVGEATLAADFEALRLDILRRELPPDLREEVHRIRQRMEIELAQETAAHHNFKTGRGGVLDVECAVQYLQLRHGQTHPELLSADRLETHLSCLRALGLLEQAHYDALNEGWDFLQRLGSRLRIVENRSISDLDEERGDLEGLALRLEYASGSREGGARRALLADYKRHTEAIRATYLAILGADESSAS
jgi:glutamate-ammonia-ligase adenylyltransferase